MLRFEDLLPVIAVAADFTSIVSVARWFCTDNFVVPTGISTLCTCTISECENALLKSVTARWVGQSGLLPVSWTRS